MSENPQNLIGIKDAARILSISPEELLFLVDRDEISAYGSPPHLFDAADIDRLRYGRESSVFDCNIPELQIPHRKYAVYLLSFFGGKFDEVNSYIGFMGSSAIPDGALKSIADAMLSFAPHDESFISAFLAGEHRQHALFSDWVKRVGVSDVYVDRMLMPLDILNNRNIRSLVEVSSSAGLPPDAISIMVKKAFDVSVPPRQIGLWADCFYRVADIPAIKFADIIRKDYVPLESEEIGNLRIHTQSPSPEAISRLQCYYVINIDRQWDDMWGIMAGMVAARVLEAIRGGKSSDAKLWADLMEQALRHGKKTVDYSIIDVAEEADGDVTVEELKDANIRRLSLS